MSEKVDRLSNTRLALYALPAIPLAALTLPLYSFIPVFYAEALGVSLASMGLVLFFVRLFDAVNDPFVGWASDKFRPAFGRRRLWFACAIPLLMLGVYKLFWPSPDAGVAYVGLWTLVLSVGYTCAILPYTAWGAELQTTYRGRARVAAWREGLILVGTLLAITVPFSIGWEDANQFHGFAVLGIIIVVLLPLFGAITLFTTAEPKEHTRKPVTLHEGLKHLRANRPFQRLLTAFFLNGFANSIAATLFLLYCAQRLDMEAERGLFIFVFFLCGIAGVPFWNFVAGQSSKHRAWCYAMVFAIIVFSVTPFLPEKAYWAFMSVCILTGFTLGADITQPAAIQADVIDVDTAQSGEQRSGTYFALWSLATKMSLALTAVLVLPVLEWAGFSASDATASTTLGITLLGFIYGWGPIAMKIPALFLMWNFPINEKDVVALRERIEAIPGKNAAIPAA
ncbi:MAG: MFS transporter [Pseudomonadota bacterium]